MFVVLSEGERTFVVYANFDFDLNIENFED